MQKHFFVSGRRPSRSRRPHRGNTNGHLPVSAWLLSTDNSDTKAGGGVYELPRGRKYEAAHGTRDGLLPPSPDSIGSSSCAERDTLVANDSPQRDRRGFAALFCIQLPPRHTEERLFGGAIRKRRGENLLSLCFSMESTASVMGCYCALAGP